MTVAVTIGCYKLVPFITLGILRWRRLIPDVPILLSDDHSPESPQIKALAEAHGCDYIAPPSRRSHFSGDWNALCNAVQFARELGVDIAIKASQRVVPILPSLLEPMYRAFSDEQCQVVVPGQMSRSQIARPGSRFLCKFGVLSDLIAIRSTAISPEELCEFYRERSRAAGNGKPIHDSFSECTLGALLDQKFQTPKHAVLQEWTNHRFGEAKRYLRKSQSNSSEYAQIALMEGLSGDASTYDLREWLLIEQKNYRPKADVV